MHIVADGQKHNGNQWRYLQNATRLSSQPALCKAEHDWNPVNSGGRFTEGNMW